MPHADSPGNPWAARRIGNTPETSAGSQEQVRVLVLVGLCWLTVLLFAPNKYPGSI